MQVRSNEIHFMMSDEEKERMAVKMEQAGIRSRSAYLRKMALDGLCIRLDLEEIRTMITLLRRCSNNLNQYAKRANESGSIYAEDIHDLQTRLDDIWELAKKLLGRLSVIK